MKTLKSASRGVSLIEALVALAVMAFGMLGVVGIQATLRFNADVSRQRTEAVRLAQEEMERVRSFGVLVTTPSQFAFADIATVPASPAAMAGSANTAYTRSTTVQAVATGAPELRQVTVAVSWLDRRTDSTGPAQTVTMSTMVAGIEPALAGTLSIPGDRSAARKPRGRHPAIPVGAVDQSNGTSRFDPPGAGGVGWIFNNTTGMITTVCDASSTCNPITAWLLSGYVNFALGGAPTTPEAELPTDAEPTSPTLGVQVNVTAPAVAAGTTNCFRSSAGGTRFAYYCLMLVNVADPLRRWSGQSVLNGFGTQLASYLSDTNTATYKVCRYTTEDSDSPVGGNQSHPLNYTNVSQSLANQNFLVINAGNGSSAYVCPVDTDTTLINAMTRRHQPIASAPP